MMERDRLYREILELTEGYKSKAPLDKETYIKGLTIIIGYLFFELNLSIECGGFYQKQKESVYELDKMHLKAYKKFLESLCEKE